MNSLKGHIEGVLFACRECVCILGTRTLAEGHGDV
jgi:hypothetical protein